MSLFELAGVVIGLIALLGYLNHTTFKLPDTIGIAAIGMILSSISLLAGYIYPAIPKAAATLTTSVDFYNLVFHGILGFLLFAGSLQIKVGELITEKWAILTLATVGVVLSTFIVGISTWSVLQLTGVDLGFYYCLLFGALISPTDPVAVLSALKKAHVSKTLEIKITGESLFNDGTAVVAFMTILGIVYAGDASSLTVSAVVKTVLIEVIGALGVGLLAGFVAVILLKKVNSYPVEIMITLSLPTLGYAAAERAHVSAPLAVVVMGLLIGNYAIKNAISEGSRQHLLKFWELMDELLNLVLFGLVGLQLMAISIDLKVLFSSVIVIACVLFSRYVSVALPISVLKKCELNSNSILLLTWGGLRGAISIALALSLPASSERSVLLTLTYCVVLFSLLVQATTLNKLIAKLKIAAQN